MFYLLQSHEGEAGSRQENVRFIGLDVHAESIVIAVAHCEDAPAEVFKTIPFDSKRLLKELGKLANDSDLRVCYTAHGQELRFLVD